VETVGLAQLRRYVVAAQGYSSRYRRAATAGVEAEIRRLSAVQLDSISTVARSHRLVLTSRIGDYREEVVSQLLAAGRVVEYWAHEASLVPAEDWPLLRRKAGDDHPWWGPVVQREPELARQVLRTLRERGPLASRHFEGRNAGSWWEWKPAKRMLEALWSAGEVVVASRQGFQRLYDLPDRVLPRSVLEAPPPTHAEMERALVLRAVQARGALTESGIAEHYRFRGRTKTVAPAVQALAEAGAVRRVAVDDGRAPVVVAADAELDGAAAPPVLLSPFDNLLWDRPFAERLFGFRHLIEVYKREHERAYGYYVLPFLWRDRIVGRADLKSNRPDGVLQVKAFHLEPGVRRSGALDEAFDRAALRLARSIGLTSVARS
jgi:uncharacterized protein YcaQ